MVFLVFGISGSLSVYISGPLLDYLNYKKYITNNILQIILRLLIIFPIYQIILLAVASILGEFKYFWNFEKKFWKAKSAENFNNNLPVNSSDPATLIFKAAMAELLKTKRQSSAIQAARVERILEIATDNELKKVEKIQNIH